MSDKNLSSSSSSPVPSLKPSCSNETVTSSTLYATASPSTILFQTVTSAASNTPLNPPACPPRDFALLHAQMQQKYGSTSSSSQVTTPRLYTPIAHNMSRSVQGKSKRGGSEKKESDSGSSSARDDGKQKSEKKSFFSLKGSKGRSTWVGGEYCTSVSSVLQSV